MKLLVSGTRFVTDQNVVTEALQKSWFLEEFTITELIHGAAKGADTLFARWAKQQGIPRRPFPADWDTHGKAAGNIRNQAMMDYALAHMPGVLFLAIWDGRREKCGTYNMIKLANSNRMRGYVHTIDLTA